MSLLGSAKLMRIAAKAADCVCRLCQSRAISGRCVADGGDSSSRPVFRAAMGPPQHLEDLLDSSWASCGNMEGVDIMC